MLQDDKEILNFHCLHLTIISQVTHGVRWKIQNVAALLDNNQINDGELFVVRSPYSNKGAVYLKFKTPHRRGAIALKN